MILIIMTMACAFGYEGLQISDDPEPVDPISELIAQQTGEASISVDTEKEAQALSVENNQASGQPVESKSSNAESILSGKKEYSVTAQNFSCTCSVDVNSMLVELKFHNDQLEYAGNLYDKISENTYKRSYMGYYILDSGEGENKTSNQVEEERHDIIILTDDGFISEHYQGDEGSPCCYHTFSLTK